MIILTSVLLSSCFFKKQVSSANQKTKEKVKLEFEIQTNQIAIEKYHKNRLLDYLDSEILATLKQTNLSDEQIKVNDLFTYENFEITNLKKQSRDSLIAQYEYSVVFDPDSYTDESYYLKPNDFAIDHLNLAHDFRFYKSDPDTLLIRMKIKYFEKDSKTNLYINSSQEIYSNWDTLVIE